MIPEDVKVKLRRSLIEHEEYRKLPYIDTVGKITIGIGYNLTDRGLDDEWINNQFQKDIAFFYNQFMDKFDWFDGLNLDRQVVLIDMAYNLGWKKFLGFARMIDAISNHDYDVAAFEMLNSEWGKQVKGRAECLAKAMLIGMYDP